MVTGKAGREGADSDQGLQVSPGTGRNDPTHNLLPEIRLVGERASTLAPRSVTGLS